MIATFHHRDFPLRDLQRRKAAGGVAVSCCVPTLNEAATISRVVTMLTRHPLVDEVVVVDSGSRDDTRALARTAGATVHLASRIRPDFGPAKGKGENLWKALFVTRGDLVVYLDGDLKHPHPRFVTGLLGPLLTRPDLHYVKACYERPGGGGRVTELLARPLLKTFWPALDGVRQPLAGEYAARRAVLEQLPYPAGYSVEAAHLVDVVERWGVSVLAQTDLGRRAHRTRPLSELGPMSEEILTRLLHRLQAEGRLAGSFAGVAGLERPPKAGVANS